MFCVPIKNKAEFFKNFKKAQKRADIIEIWFDKLNFNENDLKKVFSIKKKPIIYKTEPKLKNLEKILKYKPEYIDIDINLEKTIIKKIKNAAPKMEIIMSFHNFKGTPKDNELNKIVRKMIQKGADIVKIAGYAGDFSDSLRMLNFLEKLSRKKIKAICLCMGENGKITRTVGHIMGNYLTYAPLRLEGKTADGQISLSELKKIIK